MEKREVKMRVVIDKDTAYPVYFIIRPEEFGYSEEETQEISEEFYERYKRIRDEYTDLQGELEKLYKDKLE